MAWHLFCFLVRHFPYKFDLLLSINNVILFGAGEFSSIIPKQRDVNLPED